MNWIKKQWAGIRMNPKTVREFGFILAGFFLLAPVFVGLIKKWMFHIPFHFLPVWSGLAVASLLINLFLPKVMERMFHTAMLVSGCISFVMTKVLLFVFFYFVLTPISLTMRFIGKDLLDERIEKSAKTYWKKRDHQPKREQYKKLF